MNPKTISILITLSGLTGFLGACASGPDSVLVSTPPPPAPTAEPAVQGVAPQPRQGVATTTVPAGTNQIIVVQAPPAAQPPEAVPARPTPQHVWVAGYYIWQNNRYEWMAGHWEIPPRANATWVNPRWVTEGGNYRFYEGYWN